MNMSVMNYTIFIKDREGDLISEYTVKGQKAAMQAAEAERANPENKDNLIFVSWFRSSDGQRGYLNPNGDHKIIGKAW
jgi:hypothetical protein